ncbi:MAG: topoisomerase DNA-binding C4 zinc finger domain-containing protein [Candidatus Heimdallarchaeota archaeon]|nr:MAG: topoisomerase DNA-binding C4 zinc finger domain-containing protein [Candidatus Heimdallarchaeota archaeon]
MGAIISIFAEKPSIARALVKAFSIVYKLKFKSRKGKTRYNYVFESTISNHAIRFKIEKDEYRLRKDDQLLISSVTGHILNYDYPPPFDKDTNWHNSDPLNMIELVPIEIPIQKNMVSHIEEIGTASDVIVIATDWDGHGESIGRQILEIAARSNKKIRHGRMHFTSTNPNSLKKAFETQTDLNWDWIKQVDSLRKQDLRMGSSITRFLTVGIQNQGIKNRMISYGPCQTSVLWLITNRFLENSNFTPTKFWKVSVKIATLEGPLFLDWKENPVKEEAIVDSLITKLKKVAEGIITEYNEESASIKRPLPLDTDTLESECAQFFRISPKQVADIAERLYNNGYITYPRTESSFYLEKDLTSLAEKFTSHDEFGLVAKECIALEGVLNPSKGRFTKDHEPIKPVKAATQSEIKKSFKKTPALANQAWNIYSYIVWRFLATIHSEATVVNQYIILNAAQEEFIAKGRKIIDLGFLKFYKFRSLKGKELPRFEKGSTHLIEAFKHQGFTTPPPLWSESQLIREMARLNLGTDATRSTHIETVQKRMYTISQGPRRMLVPTALGMALYQIFTQNSEDLILPEIRGKVESWTMQIREHEKTPEDVDKLVIELTTRGLQRMKANHEEIFSTLVQSIELMTGIGKILGQCPDCQGNLILHQGKRDSRFLKCSNPLCEVSLPLPKKGELTAIYNENCRICNGTPLLISTKSYTWIMCPICWTRKAEEDRPWFCTDCNRTDCPFSGSWEVPSPEQHLGNCPECGGDVLLKFDQQNTQVICSKCNRTWKAPNLRKGTAITLSDPCEKCGRQTLSVIKRGKKPYRICVFCSLFFFQE